MHLIFKYLIYFILGIVTLTAGLIAYQIWFQPPFYFPKPTGKYAIGIKDYHWIDSSRKETFNDDPAHPNRELMITIWYPSSEKLPPKPTTQYAPYIYNFIKNNQKTIKQKLLWLFSSNSRHIYSYGKPNAILASDKTNYPVIIFSHGYGGTRENNTAQCEELSSHGYIVVAVSHTYDSFLVEFLDGRIADGQKSMDERFEKNKNFIDDFLSHDQELGVWITDVRFVLDQLEKLANDKDSIFYQKLDQQNIGMFGHSYGGAITTQMCRLDSRIKAGVDLDGPLYGQNASTPFDKPFMFILAENTIKRHNRPWTEDDWKVFHINSVEVENRFKARYLPTIKKLTQAMKHDVYTFALKDADHNDLTDLAVYKNLLSPSIGMHIMAKLGIAENTAAKSDFVAGKINGLKATEISRAYLVNFFDKYLKGKPSDLLDGHGKTYEEIEAK